MKIPVRGSMVEVAVGDAVKEGKVRGRVLLCCRLSGDSQSTLQMKRKRQTDRSSIRYGAALKDALSATFTGGATAKTGLMQIETERQNRSLSAALRAMVDSALLPTIPVSVV